MEMTSGRQRPIRLHQSIDAVEAGFGWLALFDPLLRQSRRQCLSMKSPG
jgi:hypothetical protein